MELHNRKVEVSDMAITLAAVLLQGWFACRTGAVAYIVFAVLFAFRLGSEYRTWRETHPRMYRWTPRGRDMRTAKQAQSEWDEAMSEGTTYGSEEP